MTEFERKMLALREREVKALERQEQRQIEIERANHPDFYFNGKRFYWTNGQYKGKYLE